MDMRAVRLAAGLVVLGLVASVADAEAVPSFTRQTGLTCNQCHVSFGGPVPNFTFTGKKFRINGYRLPYIAEKIEAGEPGVQDGNRMTMPLAPYISFRYQSVFAAQSKAPGADEPGKLTSNPTSRLAIFPAGAVSDNIGLWVELYLTTDGTIGDEWGLGLFSFDEFDLRYVRDLDNSLLGIGINNQSINEIAGFGPWPVGITSYLGRGNFRGWSHPNRANLFAYGWFADRFLATVMAGTGEDNLLWDRRFYSGMLAWAPFNTDAREIWLMVAGQFGNDGIPIVSNNVPAANRRTWQYNDAIQGISATRAEPAAYLSTDIGDYVRTQGELRYGFVDQGMHSLESMLRVVVAREEYEDQAKMDHNAVAGALRYVYNRTWGFDAVVNKDLTYRFTDTAGTVYDVNTALGYTGYLTYRPAMNFMIILSSGNSQRRHLASPVDTGWNWSLSMDLLF
jgi:hypothetical protein